MNNSKQWFIIEGNIGTGKSTLIKLLEKEFDTEIIYEPLNEWLSTKGLDNKNILDHFYSDQKRWAFTFQVNALITRAKSIEHIQNKSLRFVERSIHTDRNVFAMNAIENNTMNNIEMKLYDTYYNWILQKFDIEPSGYIYLRADPNISYERINKRARSEEEKIPLDYITQIHNKYDEWLFSKPSKNLLVLNVNGDFENESELFQKMITNIKVFIENSKKM